MPAEADPDPDPGEMASTDPAPGPGVPVAALTEASSADDSTSAELDPAEASGWAYSGHRSDLPLRTVMCKQSGNIHIRHTVAISCHESTCAEVVPQPQYAPSRIRVHTRVHQMHIPVLSLRPVHLHLSGTQANAQTSVQRMIIHKMALDVCPFVAKGQIKIAQPECGVELHDMPKQGTTAHFDHGFRPAGSLLHQARTGTASQNCNFHDRSLNAESIRTPALPEPWRSF